MVPGARPLPLAVGVDLVEIDRIARVLARHPERFLSRHFTPGERRQCGTHAPSLAIRWAAKEAAAKALGTGIGPVHWRDLEVVAQASGEPVLRLHGRAAEIAAQRGLTAWSVSLTHTRTFASAVVVAAGSPTD